MKNAVQELRYTDAVMKVGVYTTLIYLSLTKTGSEFLRNVDTDSRSSDPEWVGPGINLDVHLSGVAQYAANQTRNTGQTSSLFDKCNWFF